MLSMLTSHVSGGKRNVMGNCSCKSFFSTHETFSNYTSSQEIQGTKYDALLLDVCYNTQRPMMCPIEEFLTEDVIKEMRAAVSDNGSSLKISNLFCFFKFLELFFSILSDVVI